MSDSEQITQLIRDLYRIVGKLEEIAPGRRFTPDGHLVGTIGEVVAAELFGLTLNARWSAFGGSASQGSVDVLHQQDKVQLVGR